jgi:hypothetical protein
MTTKIFLQQPKRRKSLGAKSGLYDRCLRHSHPNSYKDNKVTVSWSVWSYIAKQKQNKLGDKS